MICAYCGHPSQGAKATSPTDSFELKSELMTFATCEHEEQLSQLKVKDYVSYLTTLFSMVKQQMKVIDEIEMIIVRKKADFLVRIRDFIEANSSALKASYDTANNFQKSFSKLKTIKIPSQFNRILKPNLEEYFEREKLTVWADKCLHNSVKIQRKISALEREFFPQFEQQLNDDTEALSADFKKIQSKYLIHKRLLEEDAKTLSESETHHLRTVEEIVENLNKDARTLIQEKTNRLNLLLKKTNTKLSQSIFLLGENVKELTADTRLILVFEDMPSVAHNCLEEFKSRIRFETVYRKIVDILNELTRKENQRRAKFCAEWANKIPSHLFPEMTERAKELNNKLFFVNGFADRFSGESFSGEEEARMKNIKDQIFAFCN